MKTNQEIEDIINYPEMKDIINYEEAIDYFAGACPVPYCFGCVSNKQNGGFCNGVSEAMKFNDIALSAIRKQIPMKPKNIESRKDGQYITGRCPTCNWRQSFESRDCHKWFNKFCIECGQALDWGEDDDD